MSSVLNSASIMSSENQDIRPYLGNEYFDRAIDRTIGLNEPDMLDAYQTAAAIKTLSEAGFKGKSSYRTNPYRCIQWVIQKISDIPNVVEVVRLLLDNGASASTATVSGHTVLHQAARHGMLKLAHMMIQKGAKINSGTDMRHDTNDISWTPLRLAFSANQENMMRLLLRNGADVNQVLAWKETLLDIAISDFRSKGSLIPMLLAHGASLTHRDFRNNTPFYRAVHLGNVSLARVLVAAGAEVNVGVERYQTPLTLAIEKANADMVKFLVQNGADVHAPCKEFDCALKYAVKCGNIETLQALLDNSTASADINRRGLRGVTPLHILANAIAPNAIGLFDLLIKYGAEVEVEDNTGQLLCMRPPKPEAQSW